MKTDYPFDILRFFKRFAPIYDVIDLFVWGIREKGFHLADPPRGARILDVCTGTGRQALAFGRRGFEVRGVDFSPDMLKKAKRKNRYPRVRFELADAEALPYRKNSFDVVCISFGLHEMPSPVREKVLSEILRVTKLRGKIIIIDYAFSRGKIRNLFFYHFVRLYESPYFTEFIKADLERMTEKIGFKFKDSCRSAFGYVKILKYEKPDEFVSL